MALIFYSHLNEKSNDFLEAHDFSREEIKAGWRTPCVSRALQGWRRPFWQSSDLFWDL